MENEMKATKEEQEYIDKAIEDGFVKKEYTLVKFLRKYNKYNGGDVIGVTQGNLQRLITRPAPHVKAVAQLLTPKEIIAMVEKTKAHRERCKKADLGLLPKEKLTPVVFMKKWRQYIKGDIAGFSPEKCEDLIAVDIARPYVEEQDAKEKKTAETEGGDVVVKEFRKSSLRGRPRKNG